MTGTTRRVVRATAFVTLLAIMPLAAPMAFAQSSCPKPIAEATRLLVATAPTFNDKSATVRAYARATPAKPWQPVGGPITAVLGSRGMAWGWTAKPFARPGEPVKREGDNRSPAGIFGLGQPFGMHATGLPGYMRLEKGQTFCVDDVRSPHYGRIVPRTRAGHGTSGEDMATTPLYRQGILVAYPPNRTQRAGSCIFLHVWRRPGSGTAGCIAASEGDITRLQRLVAGNPAAIAILPASATSRFAGCLPTGDRQ